MRLYVDCGHGDGYRQAQDVDYGLWADDGGSELAIVRSYGRCLLEVMHGRKHKCTLGTRFSIAARLRRAFKRQVQCLVSLHMGLNPEGSPGGRVLYATDGSIPIAEAIGLALGLPVERINPDGDHKILVLNPSVEIELGNIACWQEMKRLRCAAHCLSVCERIADTLQELFLRA